MWKPSFLLPLASLVLGQEQIPIGAPSQRLALDAIPLLGFGTWNLRTNCSQAVSYAIQIGYRHIDAAAIYGNEEEVGIGIADGLEKTGLSREDLWITSKLWNDHHDPSLVESAIDLSLAKLGLEYLDLYHMHWPVANNKGKNSIEFVDTWNAMVKLQESGKTQHLGVCNFDPHQLTHLLNNTSVVPAVHQMEMHPYLAQNEFRKLHAKYGIHVTAYSPLAGTNPTYSPGDPVPLLQSPILEKIAKKRHCSTAQVALRWGLSRNTSVIPKTSHLERIIENFESTECKLTEKDLDKIDELHQLRHRYSNPSKSWGVKLYEDLEDSKGKHEKHS